MNEVNWTEKGWKNISIRKTSMCKGPVVRKSIWHRSWECKEAHEAGEAEAKSLREQEIILST